MARPLVKREGLKRAKARRATAGARKPSKRGAEPPRDAQASHMRLLLAAKKEFAEKGLMGARVDEIARRAKVNKQLIYYHFGDKDGLYLAALEHAYIDIRVSERRLNLSDLPPDKAMSKLVGFTFDYVRDNREFVLLLINENMMKAKYLRRSTAARLERSPLVELIAETLDRGIADGLFRPKLDPVQLYISIAGMCFFYMSNIHTLSVLFDRDLRSPAALEERRSHVISFVMSSLVAPPSRIRLEHPR
ncbi:MAG: TetR family transcriptional regulator [Hyphomicrobiales bacterium]|nr:TetR family transcriptional regulator [Hyphomicrobiales bacterium]